VVLVFVFLVYSRPLRGDGVKKNLPLSSPTDQGSREVGKCLPLYFLVG